MHKAKKIILTGVITGGIIAAPMWFHYAEAQQTVQPASVSSGYPDTDHVTAALVTEQLQQQPLATGASTVVCVPAPGEASPVSDFNCGLQYPDGSYNIYRVTIPAGWQAGQQRFSDVSLITSN